MPLFEVAIIEKPTKKEAEDGAFEKLIYGPAPVVARDRQAAVIVATSQSGVPIDPNRTEVLVRPFV